MAEIEMAINSVRHGLQRDEWAIILKEKTAEHHGPVRYMPIYVGTSEADIVGRELWCMESPHLAYFDIFPRDIDTRFSKLESVVIDRFQDNVFYAKLRLSQRGERYEVGHSLPKALALSARVRAPIFAEETVLNKAATKVDS